MWRSQATWLHCQSRLIPPLALCCRCFCCQGFFFPPPSDNVSFFPRFSSFFFSPTPFIGPVSAHSCRRPAPFCFWYALRMWFGCQQTKVAVGQEETKLTLEKINFVSSYYWKAQCKSSFGYMVIRGGMLCLRTVFGPDLCIFAVDGSRVAVSCSLKPRSAGINKPREFAMQARAGNQVLITQT